MFSRTFACKDIEKEPKKRNIYYDITTIVLRKYIFNTMVRSYFTCCIATHTILKRYS